MKKRIKVSIEGQSPLLMNTITDDAKLQMQTSSKINASCEKPRPIKEAEKKLYLDDEGTIIMPQTNILRCLINAGRLGFKISKKDVTDRSGNSLLPSCIYVEEPFFWFKYKDDWTIDSRPASTSNGNKIVVHRPKFNDWNFCFTVVLDTNYMEEKMLREIIDCAGEKIGLCDYRIEKGGPFGRFKVVEWKVLEQ